MTETGRLIREARCEKGWTFARLAEETKATLGEPMLVQTIHAIETGVSRHPRGEHLRALATALGIPLDTLAASVYAVPAP